MARSKVNKKSGKKTKRTKKSVPKEDPPVMETVEETPVETPTPRKKRVVPTRESVLLGFDELISAVGDEIARLRDSAVKSTGVKFLRSVNKKVKTLRSQSSRVMKSKKKPTTRRTNANSGFLKPVRISKEMAKFTGWDPSEKRSRVDVTKYICSYIKENDLQNPEDRRQIQVEKDSKLSKLLEYDPKRDDTLTYYRLQRHMKHHFLKDEE